LLRLRHRRPAAVVAGPGGNHPTYIRRGCHRVGTVCLIAGSATTLLLVVIRQHGSAGRYQAETVYLIARSATTRRLVVICLHGSTGRYGDDATTVCLIAGSSTTRRLVVIPQPGSAGRNQADTVCPIAGSTATLCQEAGTCTLSAARGWVCPTLFWNAVDHGPSQSSGPAEQAERPGLADQFC
jgi:hypothetical protein